MGPLMSLALLIVQTVPSTAPEPGSAISAVPRSCAAGPGMDGEVVVCARARDADRLKALPYIAAPEQRFDPLLVKLPGGSSARLHAFQNILPNGAVSQGAAVTLTVPLGRKH